MFYSYSVELYSYSVELYWKQPSYPEIFVNAVINKTAFYSLTVTTDFDTLKKKQVENWCHSGICIVTNRCCQIWHTGSSKRNIHEENVEMDDTLIHLFPILDTKNSIRFSSGGNITLNSYSLACRQLTFAACEIQIQNSFVKSLNTIKCNKMFTATFRAVINRIHNHFHSKINICFICSSFLLNMVTLNAESLEQRGGCP